MDFALLLLDEFEATSQSRLDAFHVAMAAHDHETLAAKAHALRGVAGILAAQTLMEHCANLEFAAAHADWNRTSELIPQLHAELQRTIEFIPTVRAFA